MHEHGEKYWITALAGEKGNGIQLSTFCYFAHSRGHFRNALSTMRHQGTGPRRGWIVTQFLHITGNEAGHVTQYNHIALLVRQLYSAWRKCNVWFYSLEHLTELYYNQNLPLISLWQTTTNTSWDTVPANKLAPIHISQAEVFLHVCLFMQATDAQLKASHRSSVLCTRPPTSTMNIRLIILFHLTLDRRMPKEKKIQLFFHKVLLYVTLYEGNMKFNIKSHRDLLPGHCFIMCCDSFSTVMKYVGIMMVCFDLTRQFKHVWVSKCCSLSWRPTEMFSLSNQLYWIKESRMENWTLSL